MDSAMTFNILVLLCGALYWYLVGVRGDGGQPSDRLRKLIMTEALNAAEIARLECKLAEVDPEWRERYLMKAARQHGL
ncbi:Uncharacterised protein [Brevundimonas diminuta]|uniref:Uncharacterized protein n=2 Tax=Brevundimonas diminuta TaxID=293 RepID=A0A2X1AQG4_BREDI|nr:Uncharacterised protein [Brevundimonas diminuta]